MKLTWLFPFVAFLCFLTVLPAKAQMAYESAESCVSSNTNSCTPASTVVGDVGIVFAVRSGSTTAPTCTATYAYTCTSGTPYTGSGGSGSTAISWRVGCFIFTGTSQGSGTWTNAGNVILKVYRGSAGATTCTNIFSAIKGTSTAAASTTLTDTGFTLTYPSSSWLLEFNASRTATNVTNSSSVNTNSTHTGTTAMIAGGDSGGAAASFSTQTVTVGTSTENVGVVLELVVAPQLSTPTVWDALSTSGSGSGNGQHGRYTWIDPCTSGDAVFVGSQFGAGSGATAATWADDKTDSFTNIASGAGNADANQVLNLAYLSSCTSNASKLTYTITGGTPSYVESQQFVTYNVGALDTSCHNTGTGTSATCVMAALPSATGDFIACYAGQDSGTMSSPWFTVPTGYTPVLEDDISAAQQVMFAATESNRAPTTVTLTLASSLTWNIVCGMWKSASSGSAPTGNYLVHAMGLNLVVSGATTYTSYHFPTSGNLLVMSSTTGTTDLICSSGTPNCITDSKSNSWTTCGGSGQGTVTNALGGSAQMYCAPSATTGTNMTVSWTRTAAVDGDYLVFYDFHATNPTFDVRNQSGATGDQTVAGTVATAVLTPNGSTGIATWVLGVDADTVNGVNAPSGAIFDCAIPNPVQANDPDCQNNAYGHFYFASTSAQTWTGNSSAGGTAYGQWVSIADAFDSGANATCTPTFFFFGVGRCG